MSLSQFLYLYWQLILNRLLFLQLVILIFWGSDLIRFHSGGLAPKSFLSEANPISEI